MKYRNGTQLKCDMTKPGTDDPCDKHSWSFLETQQWFEKDGYGSFHRKDIFYCRNCADLKIAKRVHYLGSNHTPRLEKPDWYTKPL